ncbi:uncharacterized protein LOC135833475 [Planococcus citri]|uniref:uncharacterized protein LOC135833475 n=1 Tax=Planococcus citri TaxID=170843 RepID=UPI0031F8F526
MTEVTSEVYDIIHPTPISLKQLSAIAISLEIWRRKVKEYRTGEKLKEFDPDRLRKDNAWMKSMLPDLPSPIYKMIDEIVSRFGYSMKPWQSMHYKRVFCFQYTDENHILEDFDDFVCDYDGTIDYKRTAERMMRCDGFNLEMKFVVACLYFFEHDIRRIWPSVSECEYLDVDCIDFDNCSQLYYWICRLTNKLDKIPTLTLRSETIDERMFRAYMPYNRPSIEYFWNRIPLEKRMQKAIDHLCDHDFIRVILPKLDNQQLDKFVNGERACLFDIFYYFRFEEWIVLRTWVHIRNIINEDNFTNLIIRMFQVKDADEYEYPEQEKEKWEYLCCQIWNHTQPNLKSSVIGVISTDSSQFTANIDTYDDYECNQMNAELLLTILRDASLKKRNLFWRNCWNFLIQAVRSKDLQRVIKLCFKNEDEINQFKQNVIVKNGDVLQLCVALLDDAFLKELNAFVTFCCPELQGRRIFKQQILQSAFLDEDCLLSGEILREIDEFNDFVEDVSTYIKNRLISSPSVMERLSSIICTGLVSSETIIKFIDTLASTELKEETVVQAKKSLIDSLKKYLTRNARRPAGKIYRKDELNSILLWCLGSNEGVEEFNLKYTSW